MATIWQFLHLVLVTAGDVVLLRAPDSVLNPDAMRWRVALAVAILAALSGLLGNAGLLAINRVRGLWVVVTWALVSLQNLIALAFQGLVLWCAAWVVINDVPDVGAVVRVVLLSTAPLWFEFLVITPYIGPMIERVLWGWQLLALWMLMDHLMPDGLSQWLVLLVVVVGWLVARLVAHLLSPVVQWLRRSLWRGIMRRPLRTSATELLAAATPQLLARHHAPPTPEADAGHGLLGSRHSTTRVGE